MTNKEQIMINGVDVSGCEYLTYELEEDGEYYWFCKISPTGGPDECEYNPECFYKRVLKQLARKTQEYQNLADILRDTDTYSEVCNACKDDILIYPSISDKTNYTDNEVDAITLRRIINILEGKTQKYSELLKQHKELDDKVNRMIEEKYNLAKECEALKKELKDMTVRKIEYLDESLKYQIECEELKAEKEAIKKYLGISDKSIMQRLKELTEYKLKRQLKYIKIEEECDQYRNALDEKNKFLQNLGISAGGEFKRIKFYIESLKNKYNEKVKECEELKERLVRTEEDLKYQCVDCMNVKSDRYRKALEEIEEIAKSFNKNELCFYKEINECDCCDMGADCNYLRRAKILYIINKAKEKSDG